MDAEEYCLPVLDKMYKEYEPEKAPDLLQRMAKLIIPADAYIVVSGEYNHTIPPALANLMDHFLDEYFWKPSAIVCYSAGAFGGVRASIALRPMLAEMGTSSIPSILPIPTVQKAFDEDGTPKDNAYHERAERFLEELEWYAACLRGGQKDSRCNSFDGREPSACDRAWGQGGLVWLFLQHEPGWYALHHRTSASPGVLFTASALSIVTAQ